MCYHRRVTRIVVDTDVFVAALLGPRGASREVIRRCLLGQYQPTMGTALLTEFEDVLSRQRLFEHCALTQPEREELFDAFLRVCRWVRVYYGWRPNLPDEADNHVMELAVAAGARAIVTRNIRHLSRAELRFPGLRVMAPSQLIKEPGYGHDDDPSAG
jgi:putative PIN family toxin of toxin-antitoxin system